MLKNGFRSSVEYIPHGIAKTQIADPLHMDAQLSAGPGMGEFVDYYAGKCQVGKKEPQHGSDSFISSKVGLLTLKHKGFNH